MVRGRPEPRLSASQIRPHFVINRAPLHSQLKDTQLAAVRQLVAAEVCTEGEQAEASQMGIRGTAQETLEHWESPLLGDVAKAQPHRETEYDCAKDMEDLLFYASKRVGVASFTIMQSFRLLRRGSVVLALLKRVWTSR